MPIIEPEAGATWGERASADQLAAVLDPNGHPAKNRLLDATQKRALGSTLGDVSGARFLDFGCGTGRISQWLTDRGAKVRGVDASSEMIDAARRYAPSVDFEVSDGRPLPFEPETFDAAISIGVLQYFVPDRQRCVEVLRELLRVLRPDGRLVAIEQAHGGDLERGGTLDEYLESFEQAGFSVVATNPVRRSDARLLSLAVRWSWIASLPGASRHLLRDASRRAAVPLPASHYVDVLFVCRPSP